MHEMRFWVAQPIISPLVFVLFCALIRIWFDAVFKEGFPNEMLSRQCIVQKLVPDMNLLRIVGHHLNKYLYIRKGFESIYEGKKNG
jgi:hypothetical protein